MEQKWAADIAEKIKKKERAVVERNRHNVPYLSKDGRFDDWSDRIGWWTNGFWGGMMWQLYHTTKDPIYKETAEELEQKLDAVLMDYRSMDHDSGFRWLPTAVADYRLTGAEMSKNRGMLAASNLAGRFNPEGDFIIAWNAGDNPAVNGWAIIDCMMNLPLLYWASKESGDPHFAEIAVRHADTVREHFIRVDGSAKHIVEFDPVTGDENTSHGGQGLAQGSSWTRGQAWALYGFVLSFLHTNKERFLTTAEKVADYFVSQIPESGLIPVDFYQAKDCDFEDDIAACVAACGLLELAKVTKEWKREKYLVAAEKMLRAIDEKSCNYDENTDHLVERCSQSYHEEGHNFPIVYADYYYIEAIWKLTGEEIFLW